MAVWYGKIYKPYGMKNDGEAAMLLDDFICHKSESLRSALNADNILRFMIPPNHTCVLQPCNVGINKPLKDRLKQFASVWRREQFRSLPAGARISCPSG